MRDRAWCLRRRRRDRRANVVLTKHGKPLLESLGYTVESTRYFGPLLRCSPMASASSPTPLGRRS